MLHRRASYAALAVVLAFSMSSCDSADILQPTDAAPQFNNGNGNGAHKAPGQQKKLWSPLDASVISADEPAVDKFGRAGGSLAVSAEVDGSTYIYSLYVPRNVVRTETTFTMSVIEEGFVGVDLTAFDGSENVGDDGFRRPVTLCLNLTELGEDRRSLGVALFDESGFSPITTYEAVRDDGQDYLCGDLTHFSRFIIIHN